MSEWKCAGCLYGATEALWAQMGFHRERADEAFFASLPKAPMFLHGWTRRAEAFAAVARGFK